MQHQGPHAQQGHHDLPTQLQGLVPLAHQLHEHPELPEGKVLRLVKAALIGVPTLGIHHPIIVPTATAIAAAIQAEITIDMTMIVAE